MFCKNYYKVYYELFEYYKNLLIQWVVVFVPLIKRSFFDFTKAQGKTRSFFPALSLCPSGSTGFCAITYDTDAQSQIEKQAHAQQRFEPKWRGLLPVRFLHGRFGCFGFFA